MSELRPDALFASDPPGRRTPPPFAVIVRPQDGPIAHPTLARVIETAAELIDGRDFVLTLSFATARGYDTFRVINVMVARPDWTARAQAARSAVAPQEWVEFCCAIVAGDEPPLRFIECALTRASLTAVADQPVQVVRTANPSHH